MNSKLRLIAFSLLLLSCKKVPIPAIGKPNPVPANPGLVTCYRSSIPNEDAGLDSLSIDTCLFQGYAVIDTGYPDPQGRYTVSGKTYAKTDSGYVEIENKDMFNGKIHELEKMISDSLNENLKRDMNGTEFASCFESLEKQPDTSGEYSMNDLRISLIGDALYFSSSTGVNRNGCEPITETVASIKAEALLPYIKGNPKP